MRQPPTTIPQGQKRHNPELLGTEVRYPELKITHIAVEKIQPHPQNPRKHSRQQLRYLQRCLEKYQTVSPILLDSDLRIVAGHARWMAWKGLGMKEIPAIVLDHLTPKEITALMIADNKLGELSHWDEKLLGNVLSLLCQDLDFEPESIGFETGEIDCLIEGTLLEQDECDGSPEIAGLSITTGGDLWQLGSHCVRCGDVQDWHSLTSLMGGKRAHLAFVDPPYNVAIAGNVSGKGKTRHSDFAMATGEMNSREFTNFLRNLFEALCQFTIEGSITFCCMDWRHLQEILDAGSRTYTEVKNVCVWCKDGAGMGSFYRSQHELVFVFKNGKGPHRNNIQLGQFGRNRTNVWNYPSAASLSRKGDEGDLLALHPTVKPVAMVADAILDCTARGELVLDPFLGSGTTIIAAERTGRVCYGVEIEPRYVDVSIRRWQQLTGKDAIHEASGRTFNEMEAEVSGG